MRDDIEKARRTGRAARQISRSGLGDMHPHAQRGDLAQAPRKVLAQRSRESAWLGIEPRQDRRLPQVMIDASMLAPLLQAPLDWCVEHAHSPAELELAVGVEASRAHARLRCPFAQRPPDTVAAPAANGLPSDSTTLDSISWRLIERRTQKKRQVRVVEAPCATGQTVRATLRAMAPLILDFVASVDKARAFSVHGLPHAIVCQAALAGDHFQRLRATWSATAPQLTLVEITVQGQATEVGDPGHGRAPYIGRDGVAEALGQALVHEFSAAA